MTWARARSSRERHDADLFFADLMGVRRRARRARSQRSESAVEAETAEAETAEAETVEPRSHDCGCGGSRRTEDVESEHDHAAHHGEDASAVEAVVGQAVIDGRTIVIDTDATALATATDFDAALRSALARTAGHVAVLGDPYRPAGFAVHAWASRTSIPAPLTLELDSPRIAALLVDGGNRVYLCADPLASTPSARLRWVHVPGVREFFALPAAQQTEQRRAWIRMIAAAAPTNPRTGAAFTTAELGTLSSPLLRVLLARHADAAFPVGAKTRGGVVHGVTLPMLRRPVSEPDVYLRVISMREGKLESINAWDLGAGISLGPIQINMQRAAVLRFLWQVWQSDRTLFASALGSAPDWAMRDNAGVVELSVPVAGAPQWLRARTTDAEVARNVAWCHSGDPSRGRVADIDVAHRRDLAAQFRRLVAWPHIQALLEDVTAWWLRPGLETIHAAGIPALDPARPDRDTFVLKAMLLSTYVRFSGCLRPLLDALERWTTVADKLANWRTALASMTGPCRGDAGATDEQRARNTLLVTRLGHQQTDALEVFAALQALLGTAETNAAPAARPATTPRVTPGEAARIFDAASVGDPSLAHAAGLRVLAHAGESVPSTLPPRTWLLTRALGEGRFAELAELHDAGVGEWTLQGARGLRRIAAPQRLGNDRVLLAEQGFVEGRFEAGPFEAGPFEAGPFEAEQPIDAAPFVEDTTEDHASTHEVDDRRSEPPIGARRDAPQDERDPFDEHDPFEAREPIGPSTDDDESDEWDTPEPQEATYEGPIETGPPVVHPHHCVDLTTHVPLDIVMDEFPDVATSATPTTPPTTSMVTQPGFRTIAGLRTQLTTEAEPTGTPGEVFELTRGTVLLDTGYLRPDPADATRFEVRLRGVLCHPSDPAQPRRLPPGRDRFPIALVVHGNHDAIDGVTLADAGRPHRTRTVTIGGVSTTETVIDARATLVHEVASFRGYRHLQEHLAAQGIVSVSLDTNAANELNSMIRFRADLVLAMLDHLRALDRDPSSPLHGRLDCDRVALVGHSRGGDAVAMAAQLNRARPHARRFGLRAVVALAPTDFTGMLTSLSQRLSITAGVSASFLCVYGSHDGDVDGGFDPPSLSPGWDTVGTGFRHYDRATAQRAMVFIHGATHNRFNDVWIDPAAHAAGTASRALALAQADNFADAPFVDPGKPPSSAFPTPATHRDARVLDHAAHRTLAREYIGGWLALWLLGRWAAADRFTGVATNSLGVPVGLQWKLGRALRTVDEFDDTNPARNVQGGSVVSPGFVREQLVELDDLPHTPHNERLLQARAPSGAARVYRTELTTGSRDWRGFTALTFRVSKRFPALATPSDITAASFPPRFTITLFDGVRRASVDQSVVAPLNPRTVRPYHRTVGADDRTKVHLQTWQVPLTRFAGISLAAIRAVEITFDAGASEPIHLDTLSIVTL